MYECGEGAEAYVHSVEKKAFHIVLFSLKPALDRLLKNNKTP